MLTSPMWLHHRSGLPADGSIREPNAFCSLQIGAHSVYNIRMPAIPPEIHDQRYITLATFRKTGVAVYTPIWFAEGNGKLYFMTSSRLWKYKRIRNNPQVKFAPCTIRGKITGPEFAGTARILPPDDFLRVRRLINAKYWLARLPLIWRNTDVYVEITPDPPS